MISHEHKCIFVHVPKAAGESVETIFLGKPLNEEGSKYDGLPEKHYSAAQIRELYPKEFRSYFKFGIVRNPWDRFVSIVLYRIRRYELDSVQLRKRMHHDLPLRFFHSKSNYNMLYIDGALAVDCVARFEDLDRSLKQVWKTLGMGDITLPKKNPTPGRKRYTEYYDYYSKEFIARSQTDDLHAFGYTFEGEVEAPSGFTKAWSDARIALVRRLNGL